MQVFSGKVFKPVLKDIVQSTCTEGVTGSCGFDSVFLKEWCCFCFLSVVVCATSVFSESDKNKRNVVFFFDESCPFVIVCSIEEKFYFVVGNFQYISAFHSVFDFFAGIIKVFPERRAQAWVEGDDTASFFCNVKCVAGCFTDTFMCR